MRVVGDEQNLVFECPAFFDGRVIRQHLFSPGVGQDMHRFLLQLDQQGVFWCICDCLREVKESAGFDRLLDVDVGMPCQLDIYDSD